MKSISLPHCHSHCLPPFLPYCHPHSLTHSTPPTGLDANMCCGTHVSNLSHLQVQMHTHSLLSPSPSLLPCLSLYSVSPTSLPLSLPPSLPLPPSLSLPPSVSSCCTLARRRAALWSTTLLVAEWFSTWREPTPMKEHSPSFSGLTVLPTRLSLSSSEHTHHSTLFSAPSSLTPSLPPLSL